EDSDAVVLVVSEETGNISIVSNGEMTRDYNAVSASEKLKKLLMETSNSSNDSRVIALLKKIFKKSKEKGDEPNVKSSDENHQ
ncbi:MAG: DNA integrity scanning protein DisA nucleotide-binding domain protein, partial [Clostridia bacterium]|nr:DNA integrity scanning protein DisA nucleotide-binding domain protein [Clostridia bacterium]